MLAEIHNLEKVSRLLEPNASERNALIQQVTDYANRYLSDVDIFPTFEPDITKGQGLLDSPFANNGEKISDVLGLLHDHVDHAGINLTSGRYFGYIPGGGLFHAALGDFLAAITNRYAGLFLGSPGAVRIENMLLRWMAEEIGYPSAAAGNLASGGSLANLTAIIAARDAHEVNGHIVSKSVVYVTEHVHHCIVKALHVAGLGHCIQRRIEVDACYRMDADSLEQAISEDLKKGLKPWLVIASAGTTNTGAVDPLSAIGEIAAEHALWHHVDGAYGGFFVLCPEGKAALPGIDNSDSIVLDPHKSLFLPYGLGAVLVNNGEKLFSAFNASAEYLQYTTNEDDELSPADLSPELTKHFRGLRLWLALKVIGLEPFRAALAEKLLLAKYFYEQLNTYDGFEVGPRPDLSIFTFRYLPKKGDPNDFNNRLMLAIQQNGRVFFSSTWIDGLFVLRAATLSFRTHLEQVDEALSVLKHTAEQLEQE